MKNLACVATFAVIVMGLAGATASANLIVGPTIDVSGSVGGALSIPATTNSSWGIAFTVNRNTDLASFDFNQKGTTFGNNNAGTIYLYDTTSAPVTVMSWSVPLVPGYGAVANTVSFSGFLAHLHAGGTYQLVYQQTAGDYSNEKFAQYYSGSIFASAHNADITLTNGIENKNVVGGAVTTSTSTNIWYAFSNIQTVPEPSTFAMLGLGCLALVIRRRANVA